MSFFSSFTFALAFFFGLSLTLKSTGDSSRFLPLRSGAFVLNEVEVDFEAVSDRVLCGTGFARGIVLIWWTVLPWVNPTISISLSESSSVSITTSSYSFVSLSTLIGTSSLLSIALKLHSVVGRENRDAIECITSAMIWPLCCLRLSISVDSLVKTS